MSKVTLIIGLPGSGKTTLLNNQFQGNIDFVFDDWMGWDVWFDEKPPQNEFNEEPRYNSLINRINNNEHIVLISIRFCNHDFLCKAEYYLKSQFPNLEIERIYFENDPKKAKANILYRDNLDGGHWIKNKNNESIYLGHHYGGIRCYEISLKNIEKLSPNYTIPNKYSPQLIEIQDKKYY